MATFRPQYDTFDLFINGKYTRRCYGIKASLRLAEAQTGQLFEDRTIELVNVKTGEIVFRKGGDHEEII